MTDVPWEPTAADAGSFTRMQRLARELVFSRLRRAETGHLTFRDSEGEFSFGTRERGDPRAATITVHDPRLYGHVALWGTVGSGEAWMDGWWTADDLLAVIRFFVRNREVMDALDNGFAGLGMALLRRFHARNRNSRAGSRRNISAHYDLGNEFFEQVLDPTMTYSSGIFTGPDCTLEQAQTEKYDRLCRKLGLRAGMDVVEIGTGWGGFAVHAARNYGCHVTTTTISERQHEYARERIEREGLSDRVTLLLEDYRDLTGRYDRLVSIEMIEAVGHQYFDVYFQQCSDLLASEGAAAIQAITIADRHYEQAKRSVDFIQRYVFPGSCIPAVSVMADCLRRRTDLVVANLEDITTDYCRTLSIWRERLMDRAEAIRELGHEDEFIRLFEFYFAYCEGGFAERAIQTVQLLMTKPRFRGAPYLPDAGR